MKPKSQITKDTKKDEKLKTKAPIPSKDLNKDKNHSQLAIEKDIAKANVADAVEKVEKEGSAKYLRIKQN
jgi:hypothetical protein